MAAATLATPASASSRVQRVLARFEIACPSLREFQVVVQVSGRSDEVVVLPAGSANPKGLVEFVFTSRGGLRTCIYPHGLSPGQAASVEDLAWAIREALAEAPAAKATA